MPRLRRSRRHVDAPGRVVNRHAADADGAGVGLLEPGDHAQRRGLAAARRPQQSHHFAVLHVQVDAIDGGDGAETLDDSGNSYVRHGLPAVALGAFIGRQRRAGTGGFETRPYIGCRVPAAQAPSGMSHQ